MVNAAVPWDCANCGKVLVSGATCPNCGMPRASSVASGSTPFLLDPRHRDFYLGRAKYLRSTDSWKQTILMAIFWGMVSGVIGALYISAGTRDTYSYHSSHEVYAIPLGVVIALLWLLATHPARSYRRSLIKGSQAVQGWITHAEGQWAVHRQGRSSYWQYDVRFEFQFRANGANHTGTLKINRKDLGPQRPFSFFRSRFPVETFLANPALPAPGTSIIILYLDQNNFLAL